MVKDPASSGGRNWLLPFNDMMTLLLTFFVLLLSLARVDIIKIQAASGSVSEAFGVEAEKVAARVFDPFILPVAEESLRKETGTEAKTEEGLSPAERDALVARLNTMEGVRAWTTENGIAISMAEGTLYKAGSAELKADSPGLAALYPVLQKADVLARVEGNTSDAPSDRSRFPSNWELSAQRAINIVKLFIERGIAPQRLSAAGYGDSKPAAPGSRKQRELNNRIDIFLTFHEK